MHGASEIAVGIVASAIRGDTGSVAGGSSLRERREEARLHRDRSQVAGVDAQEGAHGPGLADGLGCRVRGGRACAGIPVQDRLVDGGRRGVMHRNTYAGPRKSLQLTDSCVSMTMEFGRQVAPSQGTPEFPRCHR